MCFRPRLPRRLLLTSHLGIDPGPKLPRGRGLPADTGARRRSKMFWSELIRYVALAGQIAFAAGIAAMITMLLKYAIG
jgi:hypothetical protein